MKFGVEVMLKDEVLDSQGRAVQDRLKTDLSTLKSVRIGKYIVLDVDEKDSYLAKEKIEKICENLLVNTLIEKFEIKQIE